MTRGALQLRAWPRVHLGLIDLGAVTERRYGGAGCAVAGPPVEVVAEPDDRLVVECSVDVDDRTREDLSRLRARLSSVLGAGGGARVEVTAIPPQHVGLGSKTALLLGVSTAALRAAGMNPSRRDLQHVSGRGGTSGAGINLFFDGGFLVDGGHAKAPSEQFQPSSSVTPSSVPPVLARHPIPQQWRFHLIQAAPAGLSGAAERELFRAVTPLPPDEVLASLAAMHHAVLPGFALGELDLVARGLADAHRVGFKRRELEAQPDGVRQVYEQLAQLPSIAVGLSSVGPLLFAISDEERSRDLIASLADEAGARSLGCVGPINHGYSLQEA